MLPHVLTFPDINPVAFSLFGLDIHWYAITYLIGFALAYVLMRRRLRHEPFRSIQEPKPYSADDVEALILYSIIGILLGGRLGYVLFYQFEHYIQNPLEIITGIRTGGMSFHGGAIGVILGMLFYCWRNKRPFLQVADLLVPTVPIGLMFGRIGNFINGELWGREASADLPWAMIFPTGGDVPRHPSQIYQALLEGLLLFILLWLYARKGRKRGQVAGAFLFGYGIFRFIVEFWREPDAHLGLLMMGMSMGQWLSVPMVVAGIILWTWAHNNGSEDTVSISDEADEANPVDGVDEGEPADTAGNEESDKAAEEESVDDQTDVGSADDEETTEKPVAATSADDEPAETAVDNSVESPSEDDKADHDTARGVDG